MTTPEAFKHVNLRLRDLNTSTPAARWLQVARFGPTILLVFVLKRLGADGCRSRALAFATPVMSRDY